MPKSSQREKKSSKSKKSSSSKPAEGRGRGRPPWATGTKLKFLERYLTDYRKIAGNKGAVKDFYNKITRLVIIKYGCDLPVDKDADEELPDPDEAALNEVDEYDGDEEEQERRDAFRRDLHRKIAAWYP
ncbi:hypothetical protein FA95DRAFT_1613390, partial [Auriscalpium vulgare]